MHIVVTGAAGFIGSRLCALLLDDGWTVRGIDRLTDFTPVAEKRRRLASLEERGRFGFDRLDLARHDLREALRGADVVFHLAGQAGVRRAVIASSINAFGVPMNPHRVEPAYFPLDEDLPADIADAYSLSKHADEATARMAWRRWGIDVVALRFPLVKDADTLRRAAESVEQDPASMAREGWAYLDLRDGVRAIEQALTVPLAGAHVVGVSADDLLINRPASELLRTYASAVPLRGPVGDRGPLVDTARARELLDFRPSFSIHRSNPSDDPLELGALHA